MSAVLEDLTQSQFDDVFGTGRGTPALKHTPRHYTSTEEQCRAAIKAARAGELEAVAAFLRERATSPQHAKRVLSSAAKKLLAPAEKQLTRGGEAYALLGFTGVVAPQSRHTVIEQAYARWDDERAVASLYHLTESELDLLCGPLAQLPLHTLCGLDLRSVRCVIAHRSSWANAKSYYNLQAQRCKRCEAALAGASESVKASSALTHGSTELPEAEQRAYRKAAVADMVAALTRWVETPGVGADSLHEVAYRVARRRFSQSAARLASARSAALLAYLVHRHGEQPGWDTPPGLALAMLQTRSPQAKAADWCELFEALLPETPVETPFPTRGDERREAQVRAIHTWLFGLV